MRNSSFYISWISFLLIACHFVDEKKTNILFVISDDQSYPHAGIYGTEWINTPVLTVWFGKGYYSPRPYTNAKCSPSRSSILTGRDSWLLEDATNHVLIFLKNLPLS